MSFKMLECKMSPISVVYVITIIVSYIHIQSKMYATASSISCSGADEMLCAYIDGLNAIFTTTDTLLSSQNQLDFESKRTDIINSDIGDGRLILFNDAPNSTLLTPSSTGYPFGDKNKITNLINNYGNDICEQSDVNDDQSPSRTSTNACRGWIYVSDPFIHNITKETAPLSIEEHEGAFAILFGRISDFNEDTLYYLYVDALSYRNDGCTDDNEECRIANAQMLLGNALFYISMLRYDYFDEIWDTMNTSSYFEYTSYYVFVNGYSDGHSYLHTIESDLHLKFKAAANQVYGKWIEYNTTIIRPESERASKGPLTEWKKAYVIGIYPNIDTGIGRLYVGSEYKIREKEGWAGWLYGVVIFSGICGLMCIMACVVMVGSYISDHCR